jgi:3-oxoacyl-[acyl-carrier protein] reductase
MEREPRVVLLTGASRANGIGAAAARLFAAREHAHVWLNYPPIEGEKEHALAAAKDVKRFRPKSVQTIEADVRDYASVDAMVKRVVETHGKVDVLVACAGILGNALLLKQSEELFDAVIKTHLYGTRHAVKAVAPHMWERSYGRIVTLASIIGTQGNYGQTVYAAAKAGICQKRGAGAAEAQDARRRD